MQTSNRFTITQQKRLRAAPWIRICFYSNALGPSRALFLILLTWSLVGLGMTKGGVPVIGSAFLGCSPLCLGSPAIRAVPVSRFGGTPGRPGVIATADLLVGVKKGEKIFVTSRSITQFGRNHVTIEYNSNAERKQWKIYNQFKFKYR